MTPPPSDVSPLDWGEDGLPRSRIYGDVYYSKQDGLAESRAVFLQGCGLPDAWAGRRRFTVGELGFGSGLNVLALLDLWRTHKPPGGQLHIFSVEAHPLSRQDAARAVEPWPQLAPVAAQLLAAWPGKARGFHRIDLPDAILDLAVMDAADALESWQGRADAWFLDGFSPSLNPGMWSEQVLRLVAARSAPGARAATFTVAGQVRRGLTTNGFDVEKRPGFGVKRERLEARLPGAVLEPPLGRIAIIGAGIAGASLARAFRALGAEPVVIEAETPGAGASGNPCALVKPRLDAGLGPPAQLHARSFARAVSLYGAMPQAVIARGALQLDSAPRDAGRFETIKASDLFEPGELEILASDETARHLGETVGVGLRFNRGMTIEPQAVLEAWLGKVRRAQVSRIEPAGAEWTLFDAAGELILQADQVCLASGAALARLAPQLVFQPVRGQLSWVEDEPIGRGVSFGGYLAPTRGGVAFGSTFDRGDDDQRARPQDDIRNLVQLAGRLPRLAHRLEGRPISSRASVRAAAPDRSPFMGEIAPGFFVLGALGSHGFTLAPLLAEALAAKVLRAPSPLPAAIELMLDPLRRRSGAG